MMWNKQKLEQYPILSAGVWLLIMATLTFVALIVYAILPNAQTDTGLKILQILQSFAVFILPALGMAYLSSEKPMHRLQLDKGISWKEAAFFAIIMWIAVPGINWLSYWNEQMVLPEALDWIEAQMRSQEDAAAKLTEQFLSVNTIPALLGNIVIMALLPAVGEELTFRGVLQGYFRKRPHLGIWLTAAIFSFVHFQFYGFVPRMLMGAMFGYVLYWSKSLWAPMLMHFVNNATAVVVYYISYNYLNNHAAVIGEDTAKTWVEEIGRGSTQWLGIVSIAIVISLLIGYKKAKTKTARIEE